MLREEGLIWNPARKNFSVLEEDRDLLVVFELIKVGNARQSGCTPSDILENFGRYFGNYN
jgi:hypothetical protein